MAIIVDTDFEGTYPPSGWAEQGTVANIGTSTVQSYSGLTSMRVNNGTAVNAWIANSAQTTKIRAMRFMLRIHTAVSATASIYQGTNANGNIFIRLTTANVIRVTMNTTNFDGPTLTADQWYLIDALIRADTNPATVDLRVNAATTASISASLAQVAANITADNIGQVTAVTCDLYFDDFKMTDQVADFPLGRLWVPYTNPMLPLIAQ